MSSVASNDLQQLVRASRVQERLAAIAEKVFAGERISAEEGIALYEHGEPGFLGMLANQVREQKNGRNVYFNHNFHVEPTNICVYSCAFCSYSRLIKQKHEGWELSVDQILDIVKRYDNQPVTEVHITGGVVPSQDIKYYTTLFRRIKEHRPSLHIKALTPVEYHYIFKKAKVSYEDGLGMMRDAGLDSIPGGGAEIFDEKIRDQIAGGKCSSEEWLSLHETWHGMGGHSNATMLYGHIETFAHRIDHMNRLRELQDRTGGFQAFIPLKFRNQNNQMAHVPEVSVVEDLRNYAVARIFLDNFQHIKAYWAMIGRNTAQLSLGFGADDLDGTIDDTTKIYSMAGAEEQHPSLTTGELVNMIKAVGKVPVQRDTLYNTVREYEYET